MINFYNDKRVQKFIDKTDNPNYDLHNIDIPFRMLCIAPSGSGKSNFICNLLKLFCIGKGTFDEVILFCKSRYEPLYEYLDEASKGNIIITEDLGKLPSLKEMNKRTSKLYIFDDLVLDKNPSIEQLFIRGRKLGCSLIFLTQTFYGTPKIIRQNTRYFVILKIAGGRDLSMILKDVAVDKTKNELLDIYKHATSQKFNVLIIDTEGNDKSKYRKNFLDYYI